MMASMNLLHQYNKTEDPYQFSKHVKLASTETCGGLAVVAGISGQKYMHHLGKTEEKNKDGEIALCINDFRKRKGIIRITWIMFELKLFRGRQKKYCTEVSESLQYPKEPKVGFRYGFISLSCHLEKKRSTLSIYKYGKFKSPDWKTYLFLDVLTDHYTVVTRHAKVL